MSEKFLLNISKEDLEFVEVPSIYKNFKIIQYTYSGTYLMETDTKGLNKWKINLPKGNYKILGFASDILKEKENITETKNFILLKI